MGAESFEFDIFVSYSSNDSDIVKTVVSLLKEVGLRVWFDKERIKYEKITEKIKSAIEQSEYFCLFSSQNTNHGQYLELECNHFLQCRKDTKPLPFILAKLSDNVALPVSVSDLNPRIQHYVDFNNSILDGFAKLTEILVKHPAGILKYYTKQEGIDDESVWGKLYDNTSRRILLMGHNRYEGLKKDSGRIIEALQDRQLEDTRIVLLSLSDPSTQQITETQRGMEKAKEDRNIKNVPTVIDNIKNALILIKRIAEKQNRKTHLLQVRTTKETMYSSVSYFDSVAIITNYSRAEDIGHNSPSFLVRKNFSNSNGLYEFYEKEFDRYFKGGKHPAIEEHDRNFNDATRIMQYKERVPIINDWIDNKNSLPKPAMMVIYPTYKCSISLSGNSSHPLCPNCIYKNELGDIHLDFNTLDKVLREAVNNLGVERIEFSGGGEPLQYKHMKDILPLLSELRKNNARFGLLTNGLELHNYSLEDIANNFNYIRFHYLQGLSNDIDKDVKRRFTENLKNFLEHVSNSYGETRVGIKVLFSKRNKATLMNDLLELREHLQDLFDRVDHIRIKATRAPKGIEPEDEECEEFCNNFYDYIYSGEWPKDTQIDLDLGKVPPEFKCILSPLVGVIDPEGSLFPCWNFLRRKESLRIGNLYNQNLEHIWGSDSHRRAIMDLQGHTSLVCEATNGCPCRFIKYQGIISNDKKRRTQYVPKGLDGFI